MLIPSECVSCGMKFTTERMQSKCDRCELLTPTVPNQLQKRDAGKPQMSRFPWRAVIPVVRVLEFGKHKYGKWGGWKDVDQAVERYSDAFFRHVTDLSEFGLTHNDEESGLPTLAHAICDAVFLLWFTCKTDPGTPWLKK